VSEGRAVVMVLLAAVMWGTTGTARALAPAEASPLAVGAVRIAIGGAALVLIALARGTLTSVRWPLVPTLVAAGAVAIYQLSFFEGVARAGVAPGTIVAIGSSPVFAGVVAWLALRERPTLRWAAATALAVGGVILLSLPRGDFSGEPLALVLPLVAGAAYATYATAAKALLRSHDNVAVAAVAFGGGALLLAPVLLVSDLGWVTTARGAVVSLELGLVATALAYVLFTRGLSRIPVAWGATLSLAEPLTASLLGTLVLGESLGAPQLAGAALVAAGLLALALAPRRS
jgi:DME family drug/metabolite transporter